jgi:hypothetical protein
MAKHIAALTTVRSRNETVRRTIGNHRRTEVKDRHDPGYGHEPIALV